MRNVWLSITVLLAVSLDVLANSNDRLPRQYKFYKLNETQGLSNYWVNDITQDSIGFVWVATQDGLFRFDGTRFKSYRNSLDTLYSIPNNQVYSVYVDKKNDVWALTDFGLAKYNYIDDRIEKIYLHKKTGIESHKNVLSVSESKSGDLYFGSFGGGVLKYNGKEFTPLTFANKLPNIVENKLDVTALEWVNSQLWIGTRQEGLIIVDLSTKISKHINPEMMTPKGDAMINDIMKDSQGNIWVGGMGGAFLFRAGGYDWVHLSKEKRASMPDDEIISVFEDSKGIIWLGTRNSGLISIQNNNASIEPSNFKVTNFEPSDFDHSVSHRTISKVFQDHVGNLWLGTHRDGLNVFNPMGEAVYTITKKVNMKNSLTNQNVWGIAEDDSGGVWIGTDGGGLNYFDPNTQKVSLFASTNKGVRISDDAILSSLIDKENNLWIATYSGGINRINLASGEVKLFNAEQKKSDLTTNDIRTIHEDSSGTLWFGTNRGGLLKYDKNIQRLESIESTKQLDIRAIDTDLDNQVIWLGCYGEGLIRLDMKGDKLQYYNWHDQGESYTPVAYDLERIGDRIFIGTSQSGLVSFDIKNETFSIFDETKGLINNTVRAIVNDNQGHLWISTNLSISAFNISDNSIINYNSLNGLQNGQFNDGSGFLSKNGYLLFGGINGLNIFYPEELLSNMAMPKITFTELKVWNTRISASKGKNGRLATNISVAEKIRLDYTDDLFTIDFDVLDFPHSEGWTFEYYLEGFDRSWNSVYQVKSATYRKVPPATYVFHARVTDKTGGIKGPEKSIVIRISPPWWRTWYAYSFFFLFFIFVLWQFIKYYNQRVKLKQTLYYEKKLRQQEHDGIQEKLRFYTNFSHELKTPITLIMGPVNDLLKNVNFSKEQKNSLQLIKRNGQVLYKLINRLLEFRKIETENTILNIGQYDLNILAQEEAESFSYLAKEKDIKFGFYSETNLMAWVDIEKVQIILNNLLSNALKYSESGEKVKFHVYHRDSQIFMEVEDRGRGVSLDEYELIFTPFYQAKNTLGTGGTGIGLSLCKNLVELHGGSIKVESEPRNGTKFTVIIPEDKKHFENKDYIRFIEAKQGDVEDFDIIEKIEESDQNIISDNESVMLVADDNQDICTYVASVFNTQFKVITVSDGEEALKIANEYVPDIIISDVMMPKMNGLEFCEHLKENTATSHIPIILLSAKSADNSKIEGYETGADAYVTKPFSSDVLLARVSNLLQSREHLKQLHENGNWIENNSVPSKELQFILDAETKIIEILNDGELNVPELCKELGFSRTSLYRKIKSLTGQSINQFIRTIKLKKAAQMLISDDVSVSEVAFSLDFTDLKYFRNCFKKQFNMLPSEYQNNMKKTVDSKNAIDDVLKMP
ncbi:MAG: response regulator [Reichenbachiella sp.]